MNKVYRTVWNECTNTWVAVQETAKAHRKSGRSRVVDVGVAALSFFGVKAVTLSAAIAGLFAMSSTRSLCCAWYLYQ